MKKLLSLSGLLLCAGCSTPEYISPAITAQEKEISRSKIALIGHPQKRKIGYAKNKAQAIKVFDKLKAAGAPICQYTSGLKHNSCSFMTLQFEKKDTVNAYAHGSKKIVLYSGLMDYTNNEDELALVIGHEMGHHLADHIKEGLNHSEIGALVGSVMLGAVGVIAEDARLTKQMATLGGVAGGIVGFLSYSKEQEQEADYIGSYLVANAGYDVEKASKFFAKMYKLNPRTGSRDLSKSALFDTHPTGDERYATLLKISREVKRKKASNQDLRPNKRSQKQ